MSDEEKEFLNDLGSYLEEVANSIKKVNDQLGYTKRVEDIEKEIKSLGWDYCRTKYHPDNNIHEPAAMPIYQLYKFVYENLVKKGEI